MNIMVNIHTLQESKDSRFGRRVKAGDVGNGEVPYAVEDCGVDDLVKGGHGRELQLLYSRQQTSAHL